jgi:ribosomal-protein-serine acetyltransferase
MFNFRVDENIVIELLQQHHKQELFTLIDTNREHLRKWLHKVVVLWGMSIG